jgi:hypothetical protein
MAASSMQMTLKKLRESGDMAGIVERFIANGRTGPGVRSDLFEIFDIISVRIDCIVGVQTCCYGRSEHWRKITTEKAVEAEAWLAAGGKIELWYWRKVKKSRGGKQMIWQPVIEEITIDDIILQ